MHHPLRVRGPRASLSELSLRCLLALAVPALSLTVLTPAAFAQEAATGTVEGRVLNASNGMYLSKARIVVEGTSIETLTNDFGEFRLTNVPTGAQKIVATFTGQESVSATVTVEGGKRVSQDLQFGKADVGEDGVIRLDPYVVQTERFRNAQEIATQEERFSVNIKNVVAADAFGDNPSGNVGDFVKYIPGILVEYGGSGGAGQGTADADPTGVSIRGIGAADTAITIDGVPVSNAFPGSLSRQVYLDTLSINNASRVEITKVPTPDMPANSVGGSVNLVSRSAFEYARPTYNYSVFLTANTEHISTRETPGPVNKDTRKMQPAANFSVAFPVSKNFGFSISGAYVPEFKVNQRATPSTWTPGTIPANSVLAGMTVEQVQATLAPVYAQQKLERYQIVDTPQITNRTSGSAKFDWKPFTGHSLSFGVDASSYSAVEGQRNLDYRTGTATSYGPDFTVGQLASNTPRVSMTVRTRDRIGDSKGYKFKYNFQYGGWSFNATANHAAASSEYQDYVNNHFSEVAAIMGGATGTSAVQVNFRDIKDGIVGKVEVIGNGGAGTAIDSSQLSGWRFDSLSAKSGEAFSEDTVDLYQADLRRELDFLPFATRVPLAFKTGFRRDEKQTRKWGRGSGYTEDLQTGKSVGFLDVYDDRYINQSPGFGLPAQQWISTYRLYALDQINDYFAATSEGQKISNWNSYVNQNKYIKETKDAWYALLEGKAFKGRFSFNGGVRQETNTRKGRGPFLDNRYNFVKNLDGTGYREDTIVTVGGVQYKPYSIGVNFGSNGNIAAPRADGTGTANIPNPLFTSNDGGIAARMKAAGLFFPTNADGTPRVLNNSTLEGRMLQLQPNRAVYAKAKGEPAYSINTSFDITSKLVAKLAWSRTFRQIDLENGTQGLLSGNGAFTFNEFATPTAGPDGNLYIGTIAMANPNVQPETSLNWDASLGYYFSNGGNVTVSYYWKTIENALVTLPVFPGSEAYEAVVSSAGYSPGSVDDYYATTTVNSDGTQKTSGLEVAVKQDLSFIGSWGKYFTLFGSLTKKNLANPVAAKAIVVNNITLVPTGQRVLTMSSNLSAAGGMNFSWKRVSSTVRFTYRNRNETTPRTSIAYTPTGGTSTIVNNIRTFEPSEIRWDASVDYKLTEKFSVYATAKDMFNNQRVKYREDDLGWLPAYSKYTDYRSFGVEVTVGIKGSF